MNKSFVRHLPDTALFFIRFNPKDFHHHDAKMLSLEALLPENEIMVWLSENSLQNDDSLADRGFMFYCDLTHAIGTASPRLSKHLASAMYIIAFTDEKLAMHFKLRFCGS